MTRPKFCVGEEVEFLGDGFHQPVPCVEITKAEYLEKGTQVEDISGNPGVTDVATWWYEGSHNIGVSTQERFFRKISPDDRTSWDDCAWRPTLDEVEV